MHSTSIQQNEYYTCLIIYCVQSVMLLTISQEYMFRIIENSLFTQENNLKKIQFPFRRLLWCHEYSSTTTVSELLEKLFLRFQEYWAKAGKWLNMNSKEIVLQNIDVWIITKQGFSGYLKKSEPNIKLWCFCT